MRRWLGAICAVFLAGPALAQAPSPPPGSPFIFDGSGVLPAPVVVPAPGGAVYLPTAQDKVLHDRFHFAPVRRAGDFVFLAGVIAGAAPGEGRDYETLKRQFRRAFETIARNLKAGGASPADVVDVTVFYAPGLHSGELPVMTLIRDEYFKPPYPAWTVIGAARREGGDDYMEIKITAYAPAAPHRRRP